MWYILQASIFIFIVYSCLNDPEVGSRASLGHMVAFGLIMAWLVTWVISKIIDLGRLCVRKNLITRSGPSGGSSHQLHGSRRVLTKRPRHTFDVRERRPTINGPK